MGRGRRCRDLREGDRIHVYSAGHKLDGKGVFIRFLEEEEDFLLGHLTCGDTIRVFSFGKQLQETGIFLHIEDFFLVWLDEKQQLNQTDLQVIHIEKLS